MQRSDPPPPVSRRSPLGRDQSSGRHPLRDRQQLVLWLLIVAGLVAGLVAVLLRHRLLPPKFFYDSHEIQGIAVSGRDRYGDRSYEDAAYIYRILGLQHSELAVGLLSLALACFVVWTAVRRTGFRVNLGGALLAAAALALAGVYLGTFSKDVFVLPLVLVILTASPTWRGTAWILVGLALYAYLFRSYWYIVLVVFLVFTLAARWVPRRAVAALGPPLALVLIGLGIWTFLGTGADFARIQVNAGRQGSVDARTLIPQYVHLPEPWSGIVNTLVVLFTILVPAPLFLRWTPYYVGAGAAFLLVWGTFLWVTLSRARLPVGATRAAFVVLALLTTQALFEPDYGSVLRHLTPVLALVSFVALSRERPDQTREGSTGDEAPDGASSDEGATTRELPPRRSRPAPTS